MKWTEIAISLLNGFYSFIFFNTHRRRNNINRMMGERTLEFSMAKTRSKTRKNHLYVCIRLHQQGEESIYEINVAKMVGVIETPTP